MVQMAFNSPRSERNIERIVALLTKPMAYDDLAAVLHMDRSLVRTYLRHLVTAEERGEVRRIMVCDWRITCARGGRRSPIYRRGGGANVPEPPAQTAADQFRKLKADPVRHAAIIVRKRMQRQKRTGKYVPPPAASPFAALGL